MKRLFVIRCLSCSREQEWGKGVDPHQSEMEIGQFLIACVCGQLAAEGDYVIRVIRVDRRPAKGFVILCNRCGENQPLIQGLHVGGLHISVSENEVNCNCGNHVEERNGHLSEYWLDPMYVQD